MMQWNPQLDPLLTGALILAVAAWCWLLHRRLLVKTTPRRARLLLIPKAALLALLALALMDPVWMVERKPDARGRLLVLRDVSTSMSVRDAATTRAARARAALAALERALAPGWTIDARVFDTEIRGAEPDPAGDADPDAGGTDLGGCLRTLAGRADLSAYRGIVILTDGGDERPDPVVLPALPVSFVAIGGDGADWNDVAIEEAAYPPSAEKGIDFEVGVELRVPPRADPAWTAALSAVRLALETRTPAGMRTLAETRVNLSSRRAFATFKVAAPEAGRAFYQVSAEPVAGEWTALNNSRSFTVDVRRKAIHALYVTRELGMDFKALRHEIGRDPGIAFTALYRTIGEQFTVQGERLPGDDGLEAGLPAEAETLAAYDCVLIGSFPAAEWTAAQMDALRTYVEQGGSAVFLGGEHSFGHGGYAGTPLAPLLPWQVAADEPALQRGRFPVHVAPSATAHPLVAGLDTLLAEESEPAVESVNVPGPLRAGATALLETRLDRRTIALLAVQPYGRGKVLGLASNSLWKWARASKPLGLAFVKIWRQAIRNLAGDGEGGRLLSVTWDQDAYRPGAQARADIRVATGNAAGIRLRASLSRGDETIPVAVEPSRGEIGFSVRLPLERRGEYAFKLTATQGNATLEDYEKILTVGPRLPEGARLEVDEEYLQDLAARTGGLCVRPDRLDVLVAALESGRLERIPASAAPLTRTGPWFFLLALACLLAEWILRRRFFLP